MGFHFALKLLFDMLPRNFVDVQQIRSNSVCVGIYIYIYIQVFSNSLAINPHITLSHATYVFFFFF